MRASAAAPQAAGRRGLARLLVRRYRLVLVASLLALVAAGAAGSGVAERLSAGGFDNPDAESTQAADALERLDAGTPNLVLLVSSPSGVDDPAVVAAGRRIAGELATEPGVRGVQSYWTTGDRRLRSDDSRSALVLAHITGDEDRVADHLDELLPEYAGSRYGVQVGIGGQAAIDREIVRVSERDLHRAELLAGPVTLVVLVLVFGSLVAAMLPLAIGVFAVVGTFAALNLLVQVTDVSVFALNVTTALGLGLAIDYALCMVTRFREELDAGQEVAPAVLTTLRTAGRTVAFSAVTVSLSLSALLVFPLPFLRSVAYAGCVVVLLAAVSAVVVLPALLVVLGHRVDRFDVRRGVRGLLGRGQHRRRYWRRAGTRRREGFWHELAMFVMRRPALLAAAVVLLLLLLGAPFTRASFAFFDDRVLPRSSDVHQVADVLREDFPSLDNEAVTVVLPGHGVHPDEAAALDDYARELSAVPGVVVVEAAQGTYEGGRRTAPASARSAVFDHPDGTWMAVLTSAGPFSEAGSRVVRDVRAVAPPPTDHTDVLVGGPAARLVDNADTIGGRLPVAGGIIAVTTMVLLFLFTGSVLIPVKAVLLNLLSLTATFGAMVWVFQEGRLQWLVGDFIVTGTLDITMPILMFCVAFGLSMDYEVFLLSRIKEHYRRTGDPLLSVASGLEKTGRLVTSAAVLIATVFVALATSGLTSLKMLGVGLALAVLVDATLVRGVLVPASMRLAGAANWWAPDLLRRVHARFGLEEAPAAVQPR